MTYSHSIKYLLEIKDPNIKIIEIPTHIPFNHKPTHKLLHGVLTYDVNQCSHCKCQNSVTKWGLKKVLVHLGQFNSHPIKLSLMKQRYRCKQCTRTFTAETDLVDKHCSLSNPMKLAVKFALQEIRPKSGIAHEYGVSSPTINRIARQASEQLKPSLHWLPEHLAIDEFKSVKSVKSAMSAIIIDNQHHRLIDIIEDRKQVSLRRYFQRYDLAVRKKVKTITMDMYGPYKDFLPRLFPNAVIIIDRFHLVQRLNTALDRIRVKVMNELRYKVSTHYTKLKTLWKLLLKNEWELDFEKYTSHRLFTGLITEKGIVDFLRNIDPRIELVYTWVNRLKALFNDHDYQGFQESLKESHLYQLPRELRKALDTMEKYQEEIKNTMYYTLSNGPIEGFNNKIKNIKRSGFGYGNFYNLQARIRVSCLLTYHRPKTIKPVIYQTKRRTLVA